MHIQEDDFNKGSQNNRKWGKDNLSNKLKKKIHMQKNEIA